MTKQSFSLTQENVEWLNFQVNNSEHSSKSDVVNNLISHARDLQLDANFIRNKLDKAEQSGFTKDTMEQILEQSKSAMNV